jgi:hypothetical protein
MKKDLPRFKIEFMKGHGMKPSNDELAVPSGGKRTAGS